MTTEQTRPGYVAFVKLSLGKPEFAWAFFEDAQPSVEDGCLVFRAGGRIADAFGPGSWSRCLAVELIGEQVFARGESERRARGLAPAEPLAIG